MIPAIRASSATCGRMSAAPSAQLTLTASSFAWLIELKNASTVWPDSVRPERSGMVTLAITGTRLTPLANTSSNANSAALQFSVSRWVSVRIRSTPPSIRARVCSANASTSSRNVTVRAPGSLTSGDSDALLVVGPIEPATNRGLPSSRSAWSAARRATCAAATLSARTWCCSS